MRNVSAEPVECQRKSNLSHVNERHGLARLYLDSILGFPYVARVRPGMMWLTVGHGKHRGWTYSEIAESSLPPLPSFPLVERASLQAIEPLCLLAGSPGRDGYHPGICSASPEVSEKIPILQRLLC